MKKEVSAGGIITRVHNGETEILLVEHRDNTYVFPKGHVETEETPEQAAKREILEEVGLEVEIGERLGVVTRIIQKDDGTEAIKDVILFATHPLNFEHQPSEETYKWLSLDEAEKVLRFSEDRAFLQNYKNSQAQEN